MGKYMKDVSKKIESGAKMISENKYFVGCIMITLAIGGRFIIDELNDDLRKLISNKIVRRTVIFCSFFMATRDIFKAILLTTVFIIILNEFLGKDDDETAEKPKGGSSYNKKELDKTIMKLKRIQNTMWKSSTWIQDTSPLDSERQIARERVYR